MSKTTVTARRGGTGTSAPRRGFLAGSAVALLGAAGTGTAGAQGPDASRKYRAIVHVTDGEPDKWNRVLSFVRGLETSIEKDDLAIAMVVQGLAADMFKIDSPVAKPLTDAAARGVELVACEYSMTIRKLARDQMIPAITRFVPFGGMEIVKRQGAGWAYLRP